MINNKSRKKNRRNIKILNGMIIICATVAVICAVFLVKQLLDYKADDDVYKDAAASYSEENTTAPADETGNTDVSDSFPEIDFISLTAEAPDVKAWLKIPGTEINYPVVHTDNDSYYLTHLYNKKAGKAGSLFIEAQNNPDFNDSNTIIYGHAMNNGSMFAYLLRFRNQDYIDDHPYGYIVTPDVKYRVHFFAAFTASPDELGSSTSPWRIDFSGPDDYASWLSKMASRSDVSSDVSVTSEDRTVTLSTCSQHGKKRYVVIGRLE